MGYESVLESVGGFGRWQLLVCLYIGIDQFFEGMVNMVIVFLQLTPEHHCDIRHLMDSNSTWTFEEMVNMSIPLRTDGKPVSCSRFDLNYRQLSRLSYAEAYSTALAAPNNVSKVNCERWHYDQSVMSETIVTQFNLVCGEEVQVANAHLVYMLGFLFGTFLSGICADAFGRKRVFLVAAVLSAIFGILQTLAPNFVLFLIFRFLLSLTNNACFQAAYVLGIEITTTKYRDYVAGLFYVPYALGYGFLALSAYWTRHWRMMHLIASAPILLNVIGFFILPESPRWLFSKGKVTEAEELLKTAARINGRPVPEKIAALHTELVVSSPVSKSEQAGIGSIFSWNFFGIFRHRVLVFRYFNMLFNWFVNAMVYYGISLNVSLFPGDVFLNNGISGLVEVPAYLLTIPLLIWGRKRSLCLVLLGIGACLAPVPWISLDLNWLRIVFVMAGKLGITTSFAIIYVYTSELYPTIIRNSGLCLSSMVGRFGSMAAPYIMLIGLKDRSFSDVPITFFSSLAIAAGLLVLFLPETLRQPLPETLEDAVQLGRHKAQVKDGSNIGGLNHDDV